ncbi:hypothetical protein L873DRAFT_1806124 [Choiromyces venosus 120613-1]|uniref:Uncharacterized protein n=1 Tax=Choiromyces venosus 120613-1 TaxID=1336337 RepID=A0A3N4JSD7_9PEZI|nr:hypothetical protein L873DRAFT_1806124 [Choiromyces venosus 120613-1]
MNINTLTVCFWYSYSWSTIPYNVWMYISIEVQLLCQLLSSPIRGSVAKK